MSKRLSVSILILTFLTLLNPTLLRSQTSQSQDYRLEQIEKLSATKSTRTATTESKQKSASITHISGSIISKIGTTLFLETNDGTKVIYTQDSTKFYQINDIEKKLIGLNDLKATDGVLIIGLAANSTSGTAKIVVRDQKKLLKNFSAFGTISELNSTTLKLSDLLRIDLPVLSTIINSETTFTNNRKMALRFEDLKSKDKVVISGYFDEKGNLVNKQIFKTDNTTSKTATFSSK